MIKVVYAQRDMAGGVPGFAIHPEAKAFNVVTEEQKARYWRSFERTRTRWYVAFGRLTGQQFAEEGRAVLKAIKGARPESVESIVNGVLRDRQQAWTKFFQSSYLAIGEDFAPAVAESIAGKGHAPAARKADEDPWMRLLLDWFSKQSGAKVTQIQGTTLDLLCRQLAEGMGAGESVEDISRRIATLYDRNIASRSTLIARTEVIGASNAASYMGAKSTGLTLRKQWLSSRDSRTRHDHGPGGGADGQEVGMDEPFIVGGEQLMWPGDTSLGASGKQTVACRCTITYRRA